MFVLENKNIVDEECVLDAMDNDSKDLVFYLDVESGAVVRRRKITKDAVKYQKPKNYYEIPKVVVAEKIGWLKEFIKEIIEVEDKELSEAIIDLLEGEEISDEEGYKESVLLFEKNGSWIHGWDQWERDNLYGKMEDWFGTLPVEVENRWEGCDDCGLCKLLENDTHSSDDLKLVAKNDYYYDAMELTGGSRGDIKMAEKLLLEALKLDEHYPQTYIGLVSVYGALKNKEKISQCINKAYEETVRIFPKWPRKMIWGILENRQYLRAIQYKAELLEEEGKRDMAVDLYKLLLQLNPGDNQGVRYVLAGIYAKISGAEINKMFDEGNKKQNWDKLEDLVMRENKKHKFWKAPEEIT